MRTRDRGLGGLLRTVASLTLVYVMVWAGIPVPALAEAAKEIATVAEEESLTLDFVANQLSDTETISRDVTSGEDKAIQDSIEQDQEVVFGAQGAIVSNPRAVTDPSMEAGQVATWDCVWFGSYPQSEVTTAGAEYASLERASWDANGDATVGGKRYRRISRSDTTHSGYWPNESAQWRFFRYDPIKWRVLEVDGSNALVFADVALDGQRYNADDIWVNWKTSSLRSWLNGYGAEQNQPGMDYSSKSFIDTAFGPSYERIAIKKTDVVYEDVFDRDLLSTRRVVKDSIFLLASSVVDDYLSPCFSHDYRVNDEARRCRATEYAHAMGVCTDSDEYDGYCRWFLLDNGYSGYYAQNVRQNGTPDSHGCGICSADVGVRPALNIDLTSNAVSWAGTVSSNGTVDEMSAPDPSNVVVNRADCGPNLQWSYVDGKLTISGTGKMTSHPWNDTYDLEGYITSLSLPDGLTSICDNAFRDCSALTCSTALPASLSSIGNGAFYGCRSLAFISIPSAITTIEDFTFANCTALVKASFPASVRHIGMCAFGGCESLQDVYYQGSQQTWEALPKDSNNEPLERAHKHFSDRHVTSVSYGRINYAPTPEEEIQVMAREYESKVGLYLEKLKKEIDKETQNGTLRKTHDEILKSLNNSGTVFTGDASRMKAYDGLVWKGLARYFDNYIDTAESWLYGLCYGSKLDLTDKNPEVSAQMIKNVRNSMGNYDKWSKTIDGHELEIRPLSDIAVGGGNDAKVASVLYVYLDGCLMGAVVSSLDETAQVLNAYIRELKKLGDDAKYETLRTIASDLSGLTNIGSWTKDKIKKLVNGEVSKLPKDGLRSSCEYLLKMREGYDVTRTITSATDASLLSVLNKPKGMADKLAGISLDDFAGCPASVVFAANAVKAAKDELVRAIYDYADGKPVERSWWVRVKEKFAESAHDSWDKVWKTVTLQCPVNVYVYDSRGNELGHIADGEVTCDDSIEMRLDGDVKTVVIPSTVDANIRLAGTDAGSMTCVVEQVVGGTVTGRANWYDVTLTDGCSYTQSVSTAPMTMSMIDPLVSESGETAPSEYIPAENENANVAVAVTAGEGGSAAGTGLYAKGDSATVCAFPDDRFSFDGWYEGDALVSPDATYRFPAVENVELEARFSFEESEDEDYVAVVSRYYADALGLAVWYDTPAADNIMVGVGGFEGELPASLTVRKLNDAGGVVEESSYTPENRNGTWLIVRGVDLKGADRTEVLMPDGTRIGTIYPEGKEILDESEPEFTHDGWKNLPGGRKGYAKGGKLVKGWLDLNGGKYHFDSLGRMLIGWNDVKVNGKVMRYYFNSSSGNLARGTWMTIDGKKYYFRISGNLATGWATISDGGTDKKYYFDSEGQMLTGWQDIEVNGKQMRYYFRPAGSMATGWATIDGEKYFFRDSGNMATGFTTVTDGTKRYFDTDGRMLIGWQNINAKTYYFRASGAMQTGRATIDGKVYEFTASGTLSSSTPLQPTGIRIEQIDSLDGDPGGTLRLRASISPSAATDAEVTWTSDDESVATVDQTGLVTSVGKRMDNVWNEYNGTAYAGAAVTTIRARTSNGLVGSYLVYVVNQICDGELMQGSTVGIDLYAPGTELSLGSYSFRYHWKDSPKNSVATSANLYRFIFPLTSAKRGDGEADVVFSIALSSGRTIIRSNPYCIELVQ